MAQSGYTPILIYASGTAAALPSAANLTSSANGAELALNYADGKLYYKNSSGVVTLLANAATAAGSPPGGSNTQVQYNNSGAFGGSANFVFDGTNVGIGTSSPATKLDVRGTPGADYGIANIFDTTSAASGVGGVLALSGYKTTTSGAAIFAKIKGIKENATAGNEAGALTFETNSGSAYTERMRITSAGNVGIGTSSPLARLTVSDSTATNGTMTLGNNGSYYGGLQYTFSTGELRISQVGGASLGTTFYTNGSERMRIDSSGNVGIGTSSPSTILHVVGSSSAITATVSSTSTTINGAPSLKVINTGSSTTNQLAEIQFRYEDGTYNANGAIAALRESGTARGQSFIFAPSNSLGDAAERMRINSSGNVGIGSSSPLSNLFVVHGNTNPQNVNHGATTNGLVLSNSYSNNRVLLWAVDGQDPAGPSSGELRIFTTPYSGTYGYYYNEAARFTIGAKFLLGGQTAGISPDGSNNLNLLGANTVQAIAKSDRVELRPTSGAYQILQQGNTYNNYKSAIVAQDITNYGRQYIYYASRNALDNNPLDLATDTYFTFQGGHVFFPLVGTTASAANAYLNNGSTPANQLLRSTSSLEYKTNVEDLDDSYSEKIYKLRPIWYRSLAQADRKDWSWFGLGAEEVAEIEPRLVHFTYNQNDWEEFTVPDPTEEYPDQVRREKQLKPGVAGKPDGVMYDRLTVLLVKEMQKLKAELNAAKERIAALEGK